MRRCCFQGQSGCLDESVLHQDLISVTYVCQAPKWPRAEPGRLGDEASQDAPCGWGLSQALGAPRKPGISLHLKNALVPDFVPLASHLLQ